MGQRSRYSRMLVVAALLGTGLTLAACDNEPDTLGDAVEEAGDQFEEGAERLGDNIEDATE